MKIAYRGQHGPRWMRNHVVINLTCSPRYLVVGAYKDRRHPMIRIYVPFVRLTVGRMNGHLSRTRWSDEG